MCCTIGNIFTSLIEGFASHFYVYVSRHHFYFFFLRSCTLDKFPASRFTLLVHIG